MRDAHTAEKPYTAGAYQERASLRVFQSSRMQFWTAELLWAELRHSKFIFVEALTNSHYLRKTVFEERAFKEMSKLK